MHDIQPNMFLFIFLAIYLLQDIASIWIDRLNRDHLKRHGSEVPKSFEGVVDESRLAEITAYTLERSRLARVERLVSDFVLLALILSGFFTFVAGVALDLGLGTVTGGLLFFLAPSLILYLVEIPFDYCATFGIEEKFGFNRSTLRIWVTDHVKSALISLVLSGTILAMVLWIMEWSPNYWWLWGFAVVSVVQLLLVELYPILIAPLFNKFTPVEDRALAEKIRSVMEEGGIHVRTILQMDAGQRSIHTNAYFTGLGKAKRIVLFDTLLQSHSHEEILGVLAHEAGHFKGRHIPKQLALFELSMLAGFYAAYRLMDWPVLYETFGFVDTQLPYVGVFFAGVLLQKAAFFLKPLYMAASRRYEREADLFSVKLMKDARPMVAALKRLAVDNLANLTPHPLYVWFNYSHPPLVERVALLEDAARSEVLRRNRQEVR